MHPLRKLRESGNPTPAQVSELLAENTVFNSPILVRPKEGREVIAARAAGASWAGYPYRRIHSAVSTNLT
jgi:hypothetical protein